MDPKLINNIRHILDISNIKNQINEFIKTNEIATESLLYPPSLSNLLVISDKIELVPFMEELDPSGGNFRAGWNLFVFGTNRKFLGYTTHQTIDELQQSEPSEYSMQNSLCETTWGEVIDFIVETMQKYEDGPTSLSDAGPDAPQAYAAKMPISNAYYERNKSVGKQI